MREAKSFGKRSGLESCLSLLQSVNTENTIEIKWFNWTDYMIKKENGKRLKRLDDLLQLCGMRCVLDARICKLKRFVGKRKAFSLSCIKKLIWAWFVSSPRLEAGVIWHLFCCLDDRLFSWLWPGTIKQWRFGVPKTHFKCSLWASFESQ